MKNHLIKTALAVSLGVAGATTVHAQNPNPNDLVLGFTSQFAGVTSDYLLDLGPIPSSSGVLSTSFNAGTFSSVFTTGSGNALTSGALNVGIVGGSSTGAIFSELDSSANPSITLAGSATPPGDTASALDAGGGIATSLTLGVIAQSAATSFFGDVAENPNAPGAQANSFAGYVDNPLTTINGTSQTVVLDLWKDSNSGRSGTTGWSYAGYVDIGLSGGNLTATFDEGLNAVPEPGSYGIFGLGGVLLFILRRRLTNKLV